MNHLSRHNLLLILYILLCVLEITGTLVESQNLILVTKPLLMPALLLWFLNVIRFRSKFKNIITVSIVFAFFGDTFLLFAPKDELFFLLGLGAFLVGQLLYGIGFIQNINNAKQKADLKIQLLALVMFCVIYIFLLKSLWHNLGEFLIPVVVYGLAICFMGVAAVFRYNVVGKQSFWLVFVGALTFVVSDTFIAIDKFLYLSKMPYAETVIMSTYCLAQYLIVNGVVVYLKENKVR